MDVNPTSWEPAVPAGEDTETTGSSPASISYWQPRQAPLLSEPQVPKLSGG